MARAGRKRKQGLYQVREPNGRLSRATEAMIEACSPSEVRRLRDAAINEMRGEEWGTEIGRLYLSGIIPAELFEAGKRWTRLVTAYHTARCAPRPDAHAHSFERRGKTHSPDPDSKEGETLSKFERRVAGEWEEAHAVLIGAGMLAERQVRATCERNEAPVGHEGLESLKRGLWWLVRHWEIGNQGVVVRSKNVHARA